MFRRKTTCLVICMVLLIIGLIIFQLWMFEGNPQWFSLRAEGPVSGNFSAHYSISACACVNKCEANNTKEIEALLNESKVMGDHLRGLVTFLPLKDTSVDIPKGRSRFTSTLQAKREHGKPEYFHFPSEASKGKILCVKGRSNHNGGFNSYGFAWQKYLPLNSSLLPGLTFVLDSDYGYANPWHGLNSMVFVSHWRKENKCASPERFVLYNWGELVTYMGSWTFNVARVALGRPVQADPLLHRDGPVCFEKAVVSRKGISGLSPDKTIDSINMIRCNARKFCNVSVDQRHVNGIPVVNVTLLARTGGRSFKNVSAVASIVNSECQKIAGCNFRVHHIEHLSFCEQVRVMSTTDVIATVHGAQLANLIFMSMGSSVMEMFPKGWLETAGAGQYVFHWLASWAGMRHEGTWRDSEGPDCPHPHERLECFRFHKDRQVGYNRTHLATWMADVLHRFQHRAMQGLHHHSPSVTCSCEYVN